MIPHILTRALLIAALSLTPTLSTADPHLDAARQLRVSGQPKAALAQLDTLTATHPDHVGYRFERGVALADLGRCGAAQRDFDTVLALAPVADVHTAVAMARKDLCPVRTSGWERTFDARIIADPNYNNATTAESIFLGPFEFALNGDARAQERYGLEANTRIGYRYGLTHRLAVVPHIGLGVLALNDADDSRLRFAPGLAFDWMGNGWAGRIGPVARFEANEEGLISRAYGLDGRVVRNIGPHDGLELSGTWARFEHKNTLDTGMRLRGEIAWIRQLGPEAWLRVSLAHGIAERTPEFRTERDTRLGVAYSRRINADFGIELAGSVGRIRADAPHPMFGEVRNDTIATASLGVTFDSIDTPLGRPIVGISHTRANSNIPLHDYSKNSVFIGFARRF